MPDSPLKDKNYNLVHAVQGALDTTWRMSGYAEDARSEGDQELADYFESVVQNTQQGAERGKKLLADRLASEGG